MKHPRMTSATICVTCMATRVGRFRRSRKQADSESTKRTLRCHDHLRTLAQLSIQTATQARCATEQQGCYPTVATDHRVSDADDQHAP